MNAAEIQRALRAWFLALRAEGRSPHTLDTYQAHLHVITKWLGTREFSIDTWRLFMVESAERYSPFSVRAYCASARSFIKFCTEEAILEDTDLLKRMKLPRVPDTPRRGLSPGQLKAMMTYLSGDRRAYGVRNYTAVLILADTGMRLGELVRLELDDLVEDTLLIRRSKNGHQRVVPLGQQSNTALLRYLRIARPHLHPTDNSLWAGWTRNGVQSVFRKLGVKLGFHVSPHAMRHTFCTEAVKAGADLETVRRIAGWRDFRMVTQYCHLQTDDLRERHRKFSLGDQLAKPSTRTATPNYP